MPCCAFYALQHGSCATGCAKARAAFVPQALWEQGQRAIPAGTCPTVGIGGHILGAVHSATA
jgi:hypothetical protein